MKGDEADGGMNQVILFRHYGHPSFHPFLLILPWCAPAILHPFFLTLRLPLSFCLTHSLPSLSLSLCF